MERERVPGSASLLRNEHKKAGDEEENGSEAPELNYKDSNVEKTSNKVEHLPELTILFYLSGIPVTKEENDKKKTNANNSGILLLLHLTVFLFMWSVLIALVVLYLQHVTDKDYDHFTNFVELYWAFHACVVYSTVSHMMYQGQNVTRLIQLSAEEETDSWRCSMLGQVKYTPKSVRQYSRICSGITMIAVLFNVAMLLAVSWGTFFYSQIPGHEWYLEIVVVLATYFYSFHWLLAVVCVYLPVHFFSHRVKYFTQCFENALSGADRDEIIRIMEWYDDLYRINKLLNFEGISKLSTMSIVMLMVLLVSLLLSLVKNPSTVHGPVLFWIFTNGAVISSIAYTVADLETVNNKILVAVASVNSSFQFAERDTALHQMMLLKVSSLPFGIFLFGTRKVFSFDVVFTLMSVLGSAFLFLVGVNST